MTLQAKLRLTLWFQLFQADPLEFGGYLQGIA
jgi:hypothetical protein